MTTSAEPSRPSVVPAVQVRRAWFVLIVASLLCTAIIIGAIATAAWVYRHATEPEIARISIVSGSGALVRSPGDSDWRLVDDDAAVREGDRVSTALGTVVTLNLFDGSTVEVTEDTILRIARMRSSRFLKRTKLVVLEPERGTIYVGMAPRGDYGFSEMTTSVGNLRVTMSVEQGREDAGSYLVEVIDSPGDSNPTDPVVRVAVLYGAATVRSDESSILLGDNEQTLIGADGSFGAITTVIRELVENGDFSHGLSGWIEFEQESQRHTGDSTGAIIELAQDVTTLGDEVVVELARSSTGDAVAQVGIRQRIGKTLRVYTSLLLSFEARIIAQRPTTVSEDFSEMPLVLQIQYIDVEDREQTWTHGYYSIDAGAGERHIPLDRATKIDHDRWQRIFFDLRGLSPLPKQITSIVVYASGQNYQTRVANVSLTTSELASPEP